MHEKKHGNSALNKKTFIHRCNNAEKATQSSLPFRRACNRPRDMLPDNGWFHIDRSTQTAMVIVPHQDDETIIAASTIKVLTNSGCKVICVFTTNGDYEFSAAFRQREAIAALELAGVPREQIVFLGYGDQYRGKMHLYNAPTDETVIPSAYGSRKTYRTKYAADFRFLSEHCHSAYTRRNYEQDLKNVLTRYKPDTILAIDYDWHPDHRATSLTFEKILGKLLCADPLYHPSVYKTFAYCLIWEVKPYLNRKGLYSTRKPSEQILEQQCGEAQIPQYRWEQRTRFPVIPDTADPVLFHNLRYQMLAKHWTQLAKFKAYSAIRGDEVFWFRRTDSLSYRAQVRVSSGTGEFLNDFKLRDCRDINLKKNSLEKAGAGIWHPSTDDMKKSASLIFEQPCAVNQVYLYENGSNDSHISAGILTFDNGFSCSTGELYPNGSATAISFPTQIVKELTFRILQADGPAYGLTEMEAYAPDKVQPEIDFIKLETNGNFIYTLFLEQKQKTCSYRIVPFDSHGVPILEKTEHQFTVVSSEGDAISIMDEFFYFPPGFKSCCLRVTCGNNPAVYDQFIIVRESGIRRLLHSFTYSIVKILFSTEYFFCRIIRKIYLMLKQIIHRYRSMRAPL